MTKGNQFTRALAMSTALSVVALGATTTTADAALDPGKSQGKSQGQAKGHDKKTTSRPPGREDQGSKDKAPRTRPRRTRPRRTTGSSAGSQGSNGSSQDQGSPAVASTGGSKSGSNGGTKTTGGQDKGSNETGNNGTVKIDGWTLDHGTGNGAPNRNEPHVDCTFDVEWYGYDASVTSTVTFEMWAPTGDVGLGAYDTSVDLDDDGASGANADGLDAVQPYEFVFTGEPHPKHGYHVKLTVNTPMSNGPTPSTRCSGSRVVRPRR